MLTSRFFTSNDKRLDTVVFPLPTPWWSRPYEYAWAAEFVKPTDVVLDAACGIAHPFKFYLAGKCKAVHAVDKDERINDYIKIGDEIQKAFGDDALKSFIESEMYCEPHCKQGDITALPYKNNMFDKVFSISVIEHLPESDIQAALKEFHRTLKKNGTLILTADYPTAAMITVKDFAENAGFKLAGDIIPALPDNAICLKYLGTKSLNCFRMALVKKKAGE